MQSACLGYCVFMIYTTNYQVPGIVCAAAQHGEYMPHVQIETCRTSSSVRIMQSMVVREKTDTHTYASELSTFRYIAKDRLT